MTHHTHADTMEHLIPSQVCTFICSYLSIHLSICLSVYLSIYLSVCLSIYLYIYLSVRYEVYQGGVRPDAPRARRHHGADTVDRLISSSAYVRV